MRVQAGAAAQAGGLQIGQAGAEGVWTQHARVVRV